VRVRVPSTALAVPSVINDARSGRSYGDGDGDGWLCQP
jgi:hypothetical protein